jgi:PAS domain S-box-containing protein
METAEKTCLQNAVSMIQLLDTAVRDAILFIRKSDGMILWANESSVRIYGFTVEELQSMRIRDLRLTDSHEAVLADMNQAFSHGLLFETIHCNKDGIMIPVEVNSSGAVYGNEEIVVSIIRDLRERKEIQRGLIKDIERKCRSAGRKLHEGLSQSLSGVMFLIRSLRCAVDANSDLETQFDLIENRIRGLVVESNNLAHYLTLVESGEKGLIAGLEALAESIERNNSPRCEVFCDKSVHAVSDDIAQYLYYAAQESSNILLSHKPGDLMEINLSLHGMMIVLEIMDNGTSLNDIKYSDISFRMIDMRARLFGGYAAYEEKEGTRKISCFMNSALQ